MEESSNASSSSLTGSLDLLKNEKNIKRWIPSEDEKNCLPYYDFLKGIFVRFDQSFVWLLPL